VTPLSLAEIDAAHAANIAAFDKAIVEVRDAWNTGVKAGHWGCSDCPNKTKCVIEWCQR